MTNKKLDSSDVRTMDYIPDESQAGNGVLLVTFNTGKRYAYTNVPHTVYSAVLGSASIGSALYHLVIKTGFKCTKLD